MRYLTIRNVPKELADAIDAERVRAGGSLNRTVLRLLAQALGVHSPGPRSNGLSRLAGGWSEDDAREFDAATARTREIDDEQWR